MVTNKTMGVIGCGWLGWPVAERMIELGHIVHGTTTTHAKLTLLQSSGVVPHLLDLSNELMDLDWFAFCDTLYISIPPRRKRANVEELYPKEISRLVDQAVFHQVRKLIFISSTGVFGENRGVVSEADRPIPNTKSGKAVLTAEKIIENSGINYTIIRMSGLVGGDREPGRWFRGRKDIPNGDCRVNMIHRDDCVSISELVITTDRCDRRIIHACADEHPKRRDFYAAHTSVDGPTFLNGCSGDKVIDNNLLKQLLGYTYQHPDPLLF